MDEEEWEADEWPRLDHPGLTSEQFIVSPNPIVGMLFGPDGVTVLAVYYERDDRFGFARWAEDR